MLARRGRGTISGEDRPQADVHRDREHSPAGRVRFDLSSAAEPQLYDFHGTGLAVRSDDPELAEALHARLSFFSRDALAGSPLRFEYRTVPDRDSHWVERPAGQGRPVYDAPLGEVLFFDVEDQLYIDYGDRVRVLVDVEEGSVSVSIAEEERANIWLLSRPMFTLPLIELLKRRGLSSVHAAGLALDGKAILVAGGTGSGKSTLALSLLLDGFDFLSDDMVFLSSDGNGVRVHAFPDEIDITDETARFFPQLELAETPMRPGWPKHQLSPQAAGARITGTCAPGILVLPSIADSERSTLEPLAGDEALLELAPNVLLTEPSSSQSQLDALAALVRQSDCYRLHTGRDIGAVPALLRELATS